MKKALYSVLSLLFIFTAFLCLSNPKTLVGLSAGASAESGDIHQSNYSPLGGGITVKDVTGFGADNETLTYDGKYHDVTVNVPEGAAVSYSEDGSDYSSASPSYRDEGTYTVYYLVTQPNCEDIHGSVTLTITPMPVTNIQAYFEQTDFEYDGTEKCPTPLFRDTSYDYTVKYINNIQPGTASAVISLTGNYSGTVTLNFKINIPDITGFTVSSNSETSSTLYWNGIYCTNYQIFRYSAAQNKYILIATTSNTDYTDKNLTQCTYYKYRVRANCSGVYGEYCSAAGLTEITPPGNIKITAKTGVVSLSWSKNARAAGYVIYRVTASNSYKAKLKIVPSNNTAAYTNTGVNNAVRYYYCILAYKTVDGKTFYSFPGLSDYSDSPEALCRGAALKPHLSYKVYDRQKKSTTSSTITLSKSDVNTLKTFAAKNFKAGMTRAEELSCTLNWINRNVKYATGNDWAKISGKSYVSSIFNCKLGQCEQYNGAMIGMMAYLGYDVSLVQGYRGTYPKNIWQHFWGEAKLCGQTYLIETGNYGKNGDWMYLLAPYAYTRGYIRNCKNMGCN